MLDIIIAKITQYIPLQSSRQEAGMVAAGEWTLAALAAAPVNTAPAALELCSQIRQALILPDSDKEGELSPTKAFGSSE